MCIVCLSACTFFKVFITPDFDCAQKQTVDVNERFAGLVLHTRTKESPLHSWFLLRWNHLHVGVCVTTSVCVFVCACVFWMSKHLARALCTMF